MKQWNRNPDPKVVKGIYNDMYARQRKDGDSEPAPAEPAAVAVRARTHDQAAEMLPAPVTDVMRVDAIRGIVGLYNRGMVSPENLLKVVVDIATEKH